MYKLIVEDVHKNYGSHEVLKGVSLKARAGDVISIIGSSGSGKSTFLRCINHLEQPSAGRIIVNAEELRTRRDARGQLCVVDPGQLRVMRSQLSMVFQHFNLWSHMTVLDNIIECPMSVLGVGRAQATERARHYLAKVGLPAKVEGQYPVHLSGGQQQRVAIARALAMEPQVMLFDEVTSALDPQLTGEVLRVIEQLAEGGMTMVLVTHEMEFAARVADTIIYMHEGKVWETGSGDMLKNPQTAELRDFLSYGL